MPSFDYQSLKKWFIIHHRELPWRENATPYSVWVSEVMLQQTRASVVIPYFERWMERFPTVEKLADAKQEEVLKLWEGLGYYSRARSLLEGARYVMEKHGGQIPADRASLEKIKGLGPYTVGAILSFAFHQKAAAVDGNVIRVLSRYFAMDGDISKSATINALRNLAEEILPEKEPWIVMEGLIELGASLCGKTPKCLECPLRRTCQGFRYGIADSLPKNSKKTAITLIYRSVAVIQCGDFFLLRKGEKGKIMADLYEFPYFEKKSSKESVKAISQMILDNFGLPVSYVKELPAVMHSFTRYRAHLSPYLFSLKLKNEVLGCEWLSFKEIEKVPFSSGHARVLELLAR